MKAWLAIGMLALVAPHHLDMTFRCRTGHDQDAALSLFTSFSNARLHGLRLSLEFGEMVY